MFLNFFVIEQNNTTGRAFSYKEMKVGSLLYNTNERLSCSLSLRGKKRTKVNTFSGATILQRLISANITGDHVCLRPFRKNRAIPFHPFKAILPGSFVVLYFIVDENPFGS